MSSPSGSAGDSDVDDGAAGPEDADQEASLEALLRFMRDHRGFDFTGYKRPSLRRRIQRRMAQIGIDDYGDYLDVLQVSSGEFEALFNTILINVTGFFRDPQTWSHLRGSALPALISGRAEEEPLRVWSAGCASGQEAYSLAIALAEILGPERFRRTVKIYATDVDEDALATARRATYTESELDGVPTDLRERYFEARSGRWSFRADLRRAVIFGRNDLVVDAPISRIDVLTCRNTLMYFTAPTQDVVLNRLRFALNPGGLLILGKAEMLLNHSRAFEAVDLPRRIFRKTSDPTVPVPPAAAPMERRGDVGPVEQLREQVFQNGAVAQLVLTADDTVAMINDQASSMFGAGARDVGRPLRDLAVSYRPVELRAAVERARLDRLSQRIPDVRFEPPGQEPMWLEVRVDCVLDARDRLLGTVVTYHDVTATQRLLDELSQANDQLSQAHDELQSTGEELETTNEELQSTVEELETTNEELQSTNEELETTNEELRSTNDELQRINIAVDERGEQAQRLNAFLESILASLQSAVIAVDTDMRVTVWNDRAQEMWGMRRDEVLGEHLFNLDIGLPVDQLRPAIRSTLTNAEDPADQHLEAVNRRGRTVSIRVMATAVRDSGLTTGTILLIE